MIVAHHQEHTTHAQSPLTMLLPTRVKRCFENFEMEMGEAIETLLLIPIATSEVIGQRWECPCFVGFAEDLGALKAL